MTLEEKIADLKANFDYVLEGKDLEIKQLGERCNQLLKDKGDLTDENRLLIQENEEMKKGLGCETCQITEEYKTLNDKIRSLEQQIEKMKCCQNCRWLWLKEYNETVTACSTCRDKSMWRLKND